MNQIANLLVLLIVTSLFLPATAIMYASGSPENSDESADGGSTESSEESDSGSMDDESDSESMDDESDSESMDDESDAWSMEKSNNALDSGSMDNNDDAMDSGSMDNNDDESDTWSMEKSNNALIPLATTPTGTNDALNPQSTGQPTVTTGPSNPPSAERPTVTNNALNPLSAGGPTVTNNALRVESNSTGNDTSTSGSTSTTTDSSTAFLQLPTTSTVSNNTGNTADFVNTILTVHNRERALVGVPPLTWSDSLAADAKVWAEQLVTTGGVGGGVGVGLGGGGGLLHDLVALDKGFGENIAGFFPWDPLRNSYGQSLWVDEKVDWHVGVLSHYGQMVWPTTKEVGCATASTGAQTASILVCRYYPGSYFEQK